MYDEPLSEEEYRKLLELGALNEADDMKIRQQMAMADRLRQGGAPQMRQVGNVSVAPHWMELIGGLAQQRSAAINTQQARAGMDQMADRKRQQNELVMYGITRPQTPGFKGQPFPMQNPHRNPAPRDPWASETDL